MRARARRLATTAALCALAAGCEFSGQAGVDGAIVADAPTADAPPTVQGPCGSPGAMIDRFDKPVRSAFWEQAGNAALDQSAGVFSISPASGVYSAFAGYGSKPFVDLRAAAATTEVVQMLDPATSALAALTVRRDSSNSASVYAQSGNLYFYLIDGGIQSQTQVGFDPAMHRFWRLAEAGGALAWDTSPDGAAWTTQRTVAAPSWVGFVRIYLGTSNLGSSASPGTVIFDNVNANAAPAAWCKAGALADDFGDGVIGDDWAHASSTSGACSFYEQNGAAQTYNYGGECLARFATARWYDLTAGRVAIQFTDAVTNQPSGWSGFFRAIDGAGKFVLWQIGDGVVCAIDSAGTDQCRPYASTTDAYLVIGESGGTIHWYAGPELTSTSEHHAAPFPDGFALDAVQMDFGTTTTSAFGGGVGLGVTSYNL
jgi:hypothetical protein